jgi:hypothetical protein
MKKLTGGVVLWVIKIPLVNGFNTRINAEGVYSIIIQLVGKVSLTSL